MGLICFCNKDVPVTVVDVDKLENGLLEVDSNIKGTPHKQNRGIKIKTSESVSGLVGLEDKKDSEEINTSRKPMEKGRICIYFYN